MKKTLIFSTIVLLCISVFMVGCSENRIDDSEQTSSDDYVVYDNLEDFLSSEQIDLYMKAQEIYPLFRGHPDCIDTLHLRLNNASFDEIRAFEVERYSICERNNDVIEGYQYSHHINKDVYLLCMGEYQNLNSFEELCLSVFTNEYWHQLNGDTGEYRGIPTFIEIDGRLYYHLTSMGQAFGYNPSEYPDKYEVTDISDSEIRFNVIGHYKSSNVDPDYTVSTSSFPIKLVLTSDGWRFALFNTAFA